MPVPPVVFSAGVAVALALTGCASPSETACPAIGWNNTLVVQIDGGAGEVAEVQLCTAEGCAPRSDMELGDPLVLIALVEQAADTWTFSTDMLDLSEVTVRTLRADGSLIADTPVAPEWVRVGGSEQCGGPAEATVSVRA